MYNCKWLVNLDRLWSWTLAVFSFLRIANDRRQPWDRSSLIKSDEGGKKERVVKTLQKAVAV